ncbi:leucyl aminopeptidase [Candidatus Phycosocius bacilliformis]|uniref:leucyl aminopeptidase n=1 Tax=Candidatus Phycosocius bacilliformis TaxID=1445552 RepID=UPI000D59A7E4|nr:leucyl aminopeptidase [Candidatus Phycosocius bacilliformis]
MRALILSFLQSRAVKRLPALHKNAATPMKIQEQAVPQTWHAALVLTLGSLVATPVLALPVSFVTAAPPSTGAIALPVGKNGQIGEAASQVDRIANGAISRAITTAAFKGNPGDTLTLYAVGPYSRVTLIGIGEGANTRIGLEDFGGRVARAALEGQAATWAVIVPDAPAIADAGALVALGARLGSYEFPQLGKTARPHTDRPLRLHVANAAAASTAWTQRWQPVGDGVKLARDLISTPSNIKSPQWYTDYIRSAFEGVPNVSITVIDEKEAARLGMGGLVGVGQGSTRPARLLAIHYRGGAKDAAPISFVGKGITFDTGGISIKPGDGMWRMRYDMAGSAASMGAVLAAAKRGAKVNVVGVAALAENMPDGNAIRPGDVLTSMSGKTMEILNTDAEGRMVLADANWWTQETFKPSLLINIATLTGSARAALGDDYAALFHNHEAAAKRVEEAGAAVGENTWRLPIHPSTRADIKSDVADVKNVVEGGAPGASIGAAFIEEWVKPETPWVHLDIAGVAWANSRKPTIPPGAVGFGVKLFDEIISQSEGR